MSQETIIRCDECKEDLTARMGERFGWFHLDHFGIATTRGTSSDFCSVGCLRKWLDKSAPESQPKPMAEWFEIQKRGTRSIDGIRCGRCDGIIPDGSTHWEHGWPLYGRLVIGCPAQAFAFLGGAKHVASHEHFLWWRGGHAAMVKNEAQEVIFEWSPRHGWRLCLECQRELLRCIGVFFKIPERVEQLK